MEQYTRCLSKHHPSCPPGQHAHIKGLPCRIVGARDGFPEVNIRGAYCGAHVLQMLTT